MRNKLRIKEGDTVEAKVANGNILLIPNKQRKFRTWIGKSPITGMPVLMSEPGAPKITSEMVEKMLEDFP
jgi:bifunctional DNA-binding transcriptional regulator/antitoxin component of YhaV-PrlF toxin-antitoxin module